MCAARAHKNHSMLCRSGHVTRIVLFSSALLLCALASAQNQNGRGGPAQESLRKASQLDLDGKGGEARELFQNAIDTATSAALKASALRSMAMSWAFEGNCKKTGEYEQMVIDYWVTQEQANPRNAFYQEGEMADEAARVCIDAGDLDASREWYKKGHDLGLKEPDISPDRKLLWEYRWAHSQARIAARHGNRLETEKHIAAAKAALDGMTQLRQQQEQFFPYLTGYAALYLGDYAKALKDLQAANQSDPFIQCLMGQAYEKLGDKAKALECYRKASQTNAHNPPAAFARPFSRKKLGELDHTALLFRCLKTYSGQMAPAVGMLGMPVQAA